MLKPYATSIHYIGIKLASLLDCIMFNLGLLLYNDPTYNNFARLLQELSVTFALKTTKFKLTLLGNMTCLLSSTNKLSIFVHF